MIPTDIQSSVPFNRKALLDAKRRKGWANSDIQRATAEIDLRPNCSGISEGAIKNHFGAGSKTQTMDAMFILLYSEIFKQSIMDFLPPENRDEIEKAIMRVCIDELDRQLKEGIAVHKVEKYQYLDRDHAYDQDLDSFIVNDRITEFPTTVSKVEKRKIALPIKLGDKEFSALAVAILDSIERSSETELDQHILKGLLKDFSPKKFTILMQDEFTDFSAEAIVRSGESFYNLDINAVTTIRDPSFSLPVITTINILLRVSDLLGVKPSLLISRRSPFRNQVKQIEATHFKNNAK